MAKETITLDYDKLRKILKSDGYKDQEIAAIERTIIECSKPK